MLEDKETFSLDSIIRGHHVYELNNHWIPMVGQEIELLLSSATSATHMLLQTINVNGHLSIENSLALSSAWRSNFKYSYRPKKVF